MFTDTEIGVDPEGQSCRLLEIGADRSTGARRHIAEDQHFCRTTGHQTGQSAFDIADPSLGRNAVDDALAAIAQQRHALDGSHSQRLRDNSVACFMHGDTPVAFRVLRCRGRKHTLQIGKQERAICGARARVRA